MGKAQFLELRDLLGVKQVMSSAVGRMNLTLTLWIKGEYVGFNPTCSNERNSLQGYFSSICHDRDSRLFRSTQENGRTHKYSTLDPRTS